VQGSVYGRADDCAGEQGEGREQRRRHGCARCKRTVADYAARVNDLAGLIAENARLAVCCVRSLCNVELASLSSRASTSFVFSVVIHR
jgi:hypothetical protein